MEPELYTTQPIEILAMQFVDIESGKLMAEWASEKVSRLMVDAFSEEIFFQIYLDETSEQTVSLSSWLCFSKEAGFHLLTDENFTLIYTKKEIT